MKKILLIFALCASFVANLFALDATIEVVKDATYNFKNFTDNFNLLGQSYDKATEVRIRADKDINYGDVIFVLKSIKEAGFLKVSLITNG